MKIKTKVLKARELSPEYMEMLEKKLDDAEYSSFNVCWDNYIAPVYIIKEFVWYYKNEPEFRVSLQIEVDEIDNEEN